MLEDLIRRVSLFLIAKFRCPIKKHVNKMHNNLNDNSEFVFQISFNNYER